MLHQLGDEIKYDMAEEENTRNTNHNIKNIDVMELRCKYFDLRLSPHSIYFPTMGWDEKVDKFGVKLSPEFIIKYLRWKFLYSDSMVWRVDDTEGTNICIILGLVAKNVEFVTGLMKKFGCQLSCNEEYPEIEDMHFGLFQFTPDEQRRNN